MFTRNVLAAAVLAAGATIGGAASAATVYDFRTPGPGSFATSLTFDTFTVTPTAIGVGNQGADYVAQSEIGLGVGGVGSPDIGQGDRFRIDGRPGNSLEALTFTFDYAVNLDNFVLSDFEANDDYSYSINGGAFIESDLAFNGLDVNNVTSFTLFASGRLFQDGITGNDEFGLQSIQVSPVPVPAALGLLGAAVAGLGFLRRRRSAA